MLEETEPLDYGSFDTGMQVQPRQSYQQQCKMAEIDISKVQEPQAITKCGEAHSGIATMDTTNVCKPVFKLMHQ
jgi:hypothetical protein